MKVHPAPKKRNIALQTTTTTSAAVSCRQKKLRRLPHIFAKVLQLPFSADADVIIDETPNFLRFIVPIEDEEFHDDDVRVNAIEIYPGVTKIVVFCGSGVVELGEFELDVWRFRLPETTLPELAWVECRDGELVVTVPKDERVGEEGVGFEQVELDRT
ncbi:hypothetical protein LIER_19166 [Lithospermum erythrorhizon]|uniref:SHSP domain-containing protein n=1 Tax=Lithospermum erythrorhizon TaxID=34254 RepID=A0AAV3QJE9_LITER